MYQELSGRFGNCIPMDNERVQKQILNVATSLAKYDLDVWSKVGPGVQLELIDVIVTLTDDELERDQRIVIAISEALLSPEIRGTTWKADAVELRTGIIPVSPEIVKIRDRAITFLLKIFLMAKNDSVRRELIGTLQQAGHTGGRGEVTDDLLKLTLSDSRRVVDFLLEKAGMLSHELKVKIEHDYFYHYRRARDLSKSPARPTCQGEAQQLMGAIESLRDKFNEDPTFVKFKVLVGFESIFPQQWKVAKEEENSDDDQLDNYRADQTRRYVESIDDQNESDWFTMIERIAAVESNDLATFPPFVNFLIHLSSSKPAIAERLLSRASENLARFLPPILEGMNKSRDVATYNRQIAKILDDRKYLAALARHLRFSETINMDFKVRTLKYAIDSNQDLAVAECLLMSMIAKPELAPPKEEFFVQAIGYLNNKQIFWWVDDAWLVRECSAFFASLSEQQASLFLPALIHAQKIEYRSERLLIEIAKHYPALVWNCFGARLSHMEAQVERYEAIPYKFHGLEIELSKDAKLAVKFGRDTYAKDSSLFQYRGGSLLGLVFPIFPENFANELGAIASIGSKYDIEFFLAVMQNYHGEESTHEVLKKIVARFPNDEEICSGVTSSLEGTGVVSGEFGYADAFRAKRDAVLAWRNDHRFEVRNFADTYIQGLELRIADEQRRAEEQKALRELRYDQGTE
jgi:hypothetical protein